MKKVFVASISRTKFDAISYSEDLQSIFSRIKELGYDGIELGIRNPLEVDVSIIESYSEKFALPVVAIGTGQAYVDEGLSLTSEDAEVQERAIERIKKHIDLASRLGASVIIGLIRGNPPSERRGEALSLLRKNLNICSGYAGESDVMILLEPVNRYESSLINRLKEGETFIQSLEKSNYGVVRLLADTFHMNIEERDIPEAIEEVFPLIGHIHVADSNRLAPGQGHTDFDSIFKKLKELGYNRYISAEILPQPSFDEATRLTMDFLRSKDILL